MAILYITRKEHFNAAHRLWNSNWSDEENYDFFGKCANPNYHGHNFDLFVTVKGTPDENTGVIMNLHDLKELIRELITSELDHKNLNIDVPWLQNSMPSIETLAVKIWERLNPRITGNAKLHKILLYETQNNFVEYFGE